MHKTTAFRYGWGNPRYINVVQELSVTLLFVSRHTFLAAGTSILGLPYQWLFGLHDTHEIMPFLFLCNISSESTCPLCLCMSFMSSFFLLRRSVCTRACKTSSRGLRRPKSIAFRVALGARHRERCLEITTGSRLLGQVISSCVIKNFKFDSLNFQGIHIEQDKFSRLFELWYSDQSY